MSRSGRDWNVPVGVEAALAFVVSAGFFALAATVINIVERHLPVLVLAAVCLFAIFAIARSWEIGRIMHLDIATINRFESDGTMTVVANCSDQPTTGVAGELQLAH